MKICTKCGIEKELSLFTRNKKSGDGSGAICKQCDSKRGCEYAKAHPEQRRRASNNWHQMHVEKHRDRTQKYIQTHPDYLRKWRAENPEQAKQSNKFHNDKKLTTPEGRLRNRISCALRRSIRENKQGRHWEHLVGYTLKDLKKHIEKQFSTGMSWERFPEIHIDHKIPLLAFNFSHPDDPDFKKAWGLNNLQPLWSADNLSKGPKLQTPFQPSLQLGG